MNRGRHRKKTEFYSIQTLPPEIKQKMLKNQERQGNKPDLRVFEKNPTAGSWNGGFSWDSTKEGFKYWDNILGKIKDLMEQRKKQKQDFK